LSAYFFFFYIFVLFIFSFLNSLPSSSLGLCCYSTSQALGFWLPYLFLDFVGGAWYARLFFWSFFLFFLVFLKGFCFHNPNLFKATDQHLSKGSFLSLSLSIFFFRFGLLLSGISSQHVSHNFLFLWEFLGHLSFWGF